MKLTRHFAFPVHLIVRASIITLLSILLFASAWAQQPVTTSNTDGMTPPGMAPGAPAGAFPLSGFENINLFNRSLNFSLPLLTVGGRGGAHMTVPLRIEKKWRVEHVIQPNIQCGPNGCTTNPPTHYYYPMWNWWTRLEPGYGPGVLEGRRSGKGTNTVFNCGLGTIKKWGESITRLTFTAADGTEYELRDQVYNGQPIQTANNCLNYNTNRGKVFVSADGSSATFISNTPIYDQDLPPISPEYIPLTGYLLLRDGTRYKIDQGFVSWIRDKNGNQITFTYDGNNSGSRVQTITDSLNRHVTFTYGDHSNGQPDIITFTGFGGATRTIEIGYANLENALRSDQTILSYQDLFPPLNGSATTYQPPVISYVKLPDDRRYTFFYNSYSELARVVLPTGGAIEYEYSGPPGYVVNGQSQDGNGYVEKEIVRYVAERRVYPNGESGTNFESKTTYGGDAFISVVTVSVYGYDTGHNLVMKSRSEHYFNGTITGDFFQNGTYYARGLTTKETTTKVFDPADPTLTTVLRRTDFVWRLRQEVSWAGATAGQPGNDPRLVSTINMLLDSNQISKQTSCPPTNSSCDPNHADGVGFDQYNNQTDSWEYDFGTGSPGALIRHTHTDYKTDGYDTIAGAPSNPDPAATIHIRNLPTKQQIFDSSGILRAQADYEYDNYNQTNPDAFHATLMPRPGISGLCDGSAQNCQDGPNFTDVTYRIRGNATGTTRQLLDTGGSIVGAVSGYVQYDVAGNVVKTIDPRSTASNIIATTFDFSDRFGSPDGEARQNTPPTNPNWLNGQTTFAFVTKVTNALGHEAYTQYDYFLGKSVNSEDANHVISNMSYNDLLDRPQIGIAGVGVTSVNHKTSFSYDDSVNNIGTFGDQDTFGDGKLQSKVKYDGLGRTIRQGMYEGNNVWMLTETRYDALGRVLKVSNPYRDGNFDSPTTQPTEWTFTDYDALSRVIRVTTPDGSHVDTAYSGNSVTVTEPFDPSQAGQPGYVIRKRTSYTDALGRLIRVIEDPNGKNHVTDYVYDVLSNLRQVTQDAPSGDPQYPGGVQQRRYFMYDSLSRLIWARNPEQDIFTDANANVLDPVTNNTKWTVRYQYDNNGNLISKHDRRSGSQSKLIAYGYDSINRLTVTNYLISTPKVTRIYDNPALGAYGIGRPWITQAGSDNPQEQEYHSMDGYDALGRPLAMTQKFKTNGVDSLPYTLQRTYDLAGHIKNQTYPSGHNVLYDYDAVGRLIKFSGYLGDNLQHTYADNIQYSETGQMTQERFLTTKNLYHSLLYNKRHQIVEVDLGTTFNSAASQFWNRGRLRFYYGLSAKNPNTNLDDPNFNPAMDYPDNNGNVIVAEHGTPEAIGSLDSIASYSIPQRDEYDYDALNRITKVNGKQRTTGGAINTIYQQSYSYDRFGNRAINAAMTSGNGINNRVYTVKVDTSIPGNSFVTNRFNELAYDVAGNVTNDPNGAGGCSYDAENRMTSASGVGNTAGGQYVYDGDGHRTRFRPNTYTAQPYWKYFVYGFDGELVAEYPLQALPNNPGTEYGYRGGEKLIVATGTSGQTPAGSTVNLAVSNNGFETPAVGAGNYVPNPANGSWAFAGASGVSGNGSLINSGNGNAPEGSQAAFLQGGSGSVISQKISSFDANRYYQIIFQAAAGGAGTGEKGEGTVFPAVFEVFVDDSSLGIFQSSSVNYSEYTTPVFLVPAGKGTIKFVARNRDGDITALIDNVRIIGSAPNIISDIKWMVTDHLGTPRMVVGLGGQLSDVSRHDYLPFGEELLLGVGTSSIRSAGNGYGGDNVRQKFVGYEQDG